MEIFSEGTSVILSLDVAARRAPFLENIWRNRPHPGLKIKISYSALDLMRYRDFIHDEIRSVNIHVVLLSPMLIVNSVDMSTTLDIPLLDSLLRMSGAFGDKELQNFIIAGILRRYPTTLDAWDKISDEQDGRLRQHFDVIELVRVHGLVAAETAVWYSICRQYSLVSFFFGVLLE